MNILFKSRALIALMIGTIMNDKIDDREISEPVMNAIPTERLVLLFMVMMITAAGNTAMNSTLPAISATLKISDIWVSLAFSWSAILWVAMAPRWARLSDKRGRKSLMALGMIGFIASMALCGITLWFGLNGFIGSTITFILFALFRMLYGALGSAAPPAVQAYVAARTQASERTKALSLLASSFGLGTVIGPAVAHYLIFQPFGLAGPMTWFAIFGLITLIVLKFRLPQDVPQFEARGIISSYPSSGSTTPRNDEKDSDSAKDNDRDKANPAQMVKLKWRDKRFAIWLWTGLIGGHSQAMLLGVIGFLVRDRLGLHDDPVATVEAIGTVMLIGAMATLLAQWGLIPILSLSPANAVSWGFILAIAGIFLVAIGDNIAEISTGFALASLGFGLYRPGFTSGTSLAVEKHEQGDVAGKTASINGAAYIFAPALGVALYGYIPILCFGLMAGSLIMLTIWSWKPMRQI